MKQGAPTTNLYSQFGSREPRGYRITSGNKTVNVNKTPLDGFFQSRGDKKINQFHELFYGPPPSTIDGRLTSNWRLRGEWPDSYVGRNLVRPIRIIWMLSKIKSMNAWINKIAPLTFTNNLSFDIQTKIYSDDMADFISLSGPVTQVASYLMEKSESISYIGKGTTMHVNMLSSPEGAMELWEIFQQVALSIIRSEVYDFIWTLRTRNYKDQERYRIERLGNDTNPVQYLRYLKQEFDMVRKEDHGIQKLVQRANKVAMLYQGEFDDIIIPYLMVNSVIFKKEYSEPLRYGSRTGGFYNKINASIKPALTDRSDDLDKGGTIAEILGLRVNVIRQMMNNNYNLYQNVLIDYLQFGSWHGLYNYKDRNLTNPKDFKKYDLAVNIYDQGMDSYVVKDFMDGLNNSLIFQPPENGGGIRHLPKNRDSTYGHPEDRKFDPFLKLDQKINDDIVNNHYNESIRLIGEMNPRGGLKWYNRLGYIGQTMNNHFKDKDSVLISSTIRSQFKTMFSYLERKPYNFKDYKNFINTNWRVQENVLPVKGGIETDWVVYGSDQKRYDRLAQTVNTGSYKFPKRVLDNNKFYIPFGMSNLWNIEEISKLDPETTVEEDAKIIPIAKKFIQYWSMHKDYLSEALPDCQFLQEGYRFSHPIFEYPKEEYNLYYQTLHNATNWLWLKHTAFSDIKLSQTVIDTLHNPGFYDFTEYVQKDTSEGNLPTDFEEITGDEGVFTPSENQETVENNPHAFPIRNIIEGGNGLKLTEENSDANFLKQLKDVGYLPRYLYNIKRKKMIDEMNKLHMMEIDSDGYVTNLTIFKHYAQQYIDKTSGIDAAAYDYNLPHGLYFNSTKFFLKLLQAEEVGKQDLNQPTISFNEFERRIKEIITTITNPTKRQNVKNDLEDYYQEVSQTRQDFLIYYNSRIQARGLLKKNRFVKTTLTLSPQLQKSISKSGGSSNVKQTKYLKLPKTNIVLEEPVEISRTKPECRWNTVSFEQSMRSNEPKNYSFHIFRFSCTNGGMSKLNEHDDNFHEYNFTPTLMKALKNSLPKGINNMFLRSKLVTLLVSGCTYDNMRGLYMQDTCPPIEFILWRLHMEYATMPMFLIGSDGKAVWRVRGNPLFMMGLDPKQGLLNYRYAQSSGTIVIDERHIWRQDHAQVARYSGGAGTDFYNLDEQIRSRIGGEEGDLYYDPRNSLFGMSEDGTGYKHIHPTEVPFGWNHDNRLIDIDFTGHYITLARSGIWDESDIMNHPPHYPTAYRALELWNWDYHKHTNNDDNFVNPNSLCGIGQSWYRNRNIEFKLKVNSQTFWGDKKTYPGVAAYRNGQVVDTKKNIYEID